jgi:hypothetical protein
LLIDVTDDDWMQWQEPRPFDPRQESLLRIVRRLAQIDLAILARPLPPLPAVDRAAPPTPGALWHITGSATAWRAFEISGGGETDVQKSFYLVSIDVEGMGSGWVVANEIPAAWRSESFRFPAATAANMFFLGWLSEGEKVGPLFAARRLAWFPGPNAVELGPAGKALGSAGFDAGLLDLVESRPTEEISRDEALCLLQLIKAAPDALESASPLPPLDVVPLLENKSTRAGEAYTVRGSVRRVTPIDVEDNAMAQSIGLPRYYQLDVFVPLGQRRINLATPNNADPLTFEHEFPVSVVVARLPEGMAEDRQPDQQVRIPAFFFRLWTYPSALSRRSDPAARQVVPLLVGGEIELVDQGGQVFDHTVTWFVLLSVVLGGLFFCGLWWTSRRERRARRSMPDRILWEKGPTGGSDASD